jgi:hypothetical protein
VSEDEVSGCCFRVKIIRTVSGPYPVVIRSKSRKTDKRRADAAGLDEYRIRLRFGKMVATLAVWGNKRLERIEAFVQAQAK